MKIKLNVDKYGCTSMEILEAALLSAFQEVKDTCHGDYTCLDCSSQNLCNDLYIALAKLDIRQCRNKGES